MCGRSYKFSVSPRSFQSVPLATVRPGSPAISATARHTGAAEILLAPPEYNAAKQIECAVDMHVDARMCDVWNYFIIFAP